MEKKDNFSFVKGVWVFVFGCILGFIIETIFYIIKYGHFVNKQGLLYGPFKPIYGIGAVLITLAYYLIKNKKSYMVFIYGTIIGTIFEYISSLFIELVFKSYIWDYSNFKWNLNGRIYLPYCLMWGVIALCWIKLIYPFLKKIYNKLSDYKYFNLVSIIVAVLMILNVLLTGIVFIRNAHKDSHNIIYNTIDKVYPEKKINKKFPKIRPKK